MKPANLTFEQAAALPVAGLTALQGLRDKGRVQQGQKVVINGAAGNGTFVAAGVRPGGRWIGPLPYLLRLLVWSRFVSQKVVFFVARVNSEQLLALSRLIEANKVTPVIDRRYTFSEVAEAIRYLKEGHARGKVVIAVA